MASNRVRLNENYFTALDKPGAFILLSF